MGDVKCRVRTPARNCSLRFSRKDLRRDLRLRGKVKPAKDRDNFRYAIK